MASYFAGVMVRLMLTLTPVVCISAAMAVSRLYATYLDPVHPSATAAIQPAQRRIEQELLADEATTAAPLSPPSKSAKKRKQAAAAPAIVPSAATTQPPAASAASVVGASRWAKSPGVFGLDVRALVIALFTLFLVQFCLHCTWVTSSAYSSPSVVLASRGPNGEQHIIDDFREAYYWLRENTAEDSKIMSWWCVASGIRSHHTVVKMTQGLWLPDRWLRRSHDARGQQHVRRYHPYPVKV
jgi:dolichyl-diphosphooligosaccharide--protein glycosyltransferase